MDHFHILWQDITQDHSHNKYDRDDIIGKHIMHNLRKLFPDFRLC